MRLNNRLKKRANDDQSEDGFTLIEVLVAVALFVICATVTARALVGNIVASRQVKERTQASNVAQSALSALQREKTWPSAYLTELDGYKLKISATPSSCETGSTRTVTILVFGPRVADTSSMTAKPLARTDSMIKC